MYTFDSPRMIYLKTINSHGERFKVDRVHTHVKGLVTFELEGELVAQAAKANIEYWRVLEEEND